MERRAVLGLSGAALAGAGLFRSAAAAGPGQDAPVIDVISVKDARFGATGTFGTDDTKAIQAAADYCFGSPEAPHGSAKVTANRILYFPPGEYRISTPIRFSKMHGARVLGSGRFVSKIVNVAGGSVFSTNGCGYSHFEGMYLQSQGRSAAVFDLNWDNSPGGPALQSNTFFDMFFDGGAVGLEIGAGGYMGSENIFINCFWIRSAVAGLKTSNFNALQNTVVGGNFQVCNMGIWVLRGSVCVIESVGFQLSKQWDIRVDNSANDTMNIIGCRTESSNFVQLKNSVHAFIQGCSQTEAGEAGYFLQPNECPVTVERCVSIKGQIWLSPVPRLTIRGSSFGRTDWLRYTYVGPGRAVELEDVQYGGTPNSHGAGAAIRIGKQRLSSEGFQDYAMVPAAKNSQPKQ